MQEKEAIEFVVLLAQAGNQASAAIALSRSQTVVSARLKKARTVLGDGRVIALIKEHKKDEASGVNLLKPFIINKPECSKCGGERVPNFRGELVCLACHNRRNQEYKKRHAPRVAEGRAAYRKANRETLLEKKRAYRAANPGMDAAYYKENADAIKARVGRYREENWDKISAQFAHRRNTDPAFREAKNANLRAWKKRHPERVNAQTAKRYAAKLRAIPSWADLKDIASFYALAKLRSKLTGIEWHVDHVVPLNSDIVCGLHCEANLQVIPAGPNISKGNAWWPDMPDAPADCVTFAERPSLYLVPPSTPAPLLTERLLRPALAA